MPAGVYSKERMAVSADLKDHDTFKDLPEDDIRCQNDCYGNTPSTGRCCKPVALMDLRSLQTGMTRESFKLQIFLVYPRST